MVEDLLRPAVRMRMSVMRAARVKSKGKVVRRMAVVFLAMALFELVTMMMMVVVVTEEGDMCQVR